MSPSRSSLATTRRPSTPDRLHFDFAFTFFSCRRRRGRGGRAAALRCRVGKGVAVLCGTHPELRPARAWLLLAPAAEEEKSGGGRQRRRGGGGRRGRRT